MASEKLSLADLHWCLISKREPGKSIKDSDPLHRGTLEDYIQHLPPHTLHIDWTTHRCFISSPPDLPYAQRRWHLHPSTTLIPEHYSIAVTDHSKRPMKTVPVKPRSTAREDELAPPPNDEEVENALKRAFLGEETHWYVGDEERYWVERFRSPFLVAEEMGVRIGEAARLHRQMVLAAQNLDQEKTQGVSGGRAGKEVESRVGQVGWEEDEADGLEVATEEENDDPSHKE